MTQNLIDPALYQELQEAMGAEFAAELLDTFLGDAKNMFADLQNAVEAADVDGYRRASHSIKSNAQTFGAEVLASDARTMELSGAIDPDAANSLQATFDKTAVALKGLKNG